MTQIIPHWLSKQASLHPNKIAIETVDRQSITFSQLEKESKLIAKRLAYKEVREGTKVAILSTNHIDMIYTLHALSYLGAIAVLLNIRLTPHELHFQLEQSEAELLLTTESLKFEKNLSFGKQYTFKDMKNWGKCQVELKEEIDLSAPYTMMFTSGTTGLPKGVVHTYGNHWWSAIGSVLNLGLKDDDKWLLTLPLFHVGGFSILIRSVTYGMTVYFMEVYDVHTLKDALFKRNVTIASLVTLMLQQLVDQLKDQPLPNYVRTILLGGGSVPEPLLKRIEQKKIPLFQSYGMTETSSQIVTLSAAYAREKLGSAGKPLLPAHIKISNKNEENIGEILVRGPMVFSGYYKLDEENEHSFVDGWFRTGDLGYLDEEGFLYVVDRRTDLIISGGENIYPTEVENVLLNYPSVEEVAVVGKQDETWGHVPVAFIVSEQTMNEQELIQHAKKHLAAYKIPKHIYFKDSLPKNASNKIMRHRLANLVNGRQ